MKNLSAILFTLLVLFNALGFYTIFLGWEYKNETQLIQSFDRGNYNTEHEITLQIPVSIPYATDQADFERVNGEFNYKGEVYRLVKQRYSNDTLHIVCVRDVESKRIHSALQDYVKTLSAHADNSKNSNKITISFIKDYYQPLFAVSHQSWGWSSSLYHADGDAPFHSFYYADIVHPPERG